MAPVLKADCFLAFGHCVSKLQLKINYRRRSGAAETIPDPFRHVAEFVEFPTLVPDRIELLGNVVEQAQLDTPSQFSGPLRRSKHPTALPGCDTHGTQPQDEEENGVNDGDEKQRDDEI